MSLNRLIFTALGVLAPFWSMLAQTKFEREYRLKAEEVHTKAVQFIDSCGFTSRIKWYAEESQDGKSVEAKLKQNGIRYSIEFDTLGNLQDAEIDISRNKIPPATLRSIHKELNAIFVRHKLKRIQRQWTGSRKAVLEMIQKGKTPLNVTTKYEIIVKGKGENGVRMYEILFDESGSMEKKLIIEFNNTDNLDY